VQQVAHVVKGHDDHDDAACKIDTVYPFHGYILGSSKLQGFVVLLLIYKGLFGKLTARIARLKEG
jgi:hypothetical protein